MTDYQQIPHVFHAVHAFGDGRALISAKEWEGIEVRRLHHWVELSLRTEDSEEARQLLLVLNEVVQGQGYEQGKRLAYEEQSMPGSMRAGVYREGIEIGFAEAMSQKAGEL